MTGPLPVALALLAGPAAAAAPCEAVAVEAVARVEDGDCGWLLAQAGSACGEVPVAWERIPVPHGPDWGGGEVRWPLSDLAEDCLAAAPDQALTALHEPPGARRRQVLLAALARSDVPVPGTLRVHLHDALAHGAVDEVGHAAAVLARAPAHDADAPALVAAAARIAGPPVDRQRPALALGRIGAALRTRGADPAPAVDGLLVAAETDPTGALEAAVDVVGDPEQDPRLLALALSFRDAPAPPGDAGRDLLAALGDPGRAVLLGARPEHRFARSDLLITLFDDAATLDPAEPGTAALLAWTSTWEEPAQRRQLAAQLRKHAAGVGHPAAWQPVLARLAEDPDLEVRRTALRAWLALSPRLPPADRDALLARLAAMLDGDAAAADLARTVVADARDAATDLAQARAWLAARR